MFRLLLLIGIIFVLSISYYIYQTYSKEEILDMFTSYPLFMIVASLTAFGLISFVAFKGKINWATLIF